ncbi:MAG: MaoC family dehydratase N-terminal domain-containing protein [Deltaproteobacteria bacterium]|nr:MaoC family dehydratase N-terminal domain-containing protein [Deltaproteobacteria bacterium]MCB9785949.1 MaoC family dehydratase N-terminal domain-containing protein [Deltaproteobacteria bacterium]
MEALAPETAVGLGDVRAKVYGRALEDFVPGAVFVHPRGRTLDAGFLTDYATTFMEANPLYLNEPFARSQGYDGLPAAPHLVMNIALSLGVQNDSELAIANLGYYDVRFLRPVLAGDTLTARTEVEARRDRGPGKPGIVTVRTLAQDQRGRVVVQYRRKILVPRRSDAPLDSTAQPRREGEFPWTERPSLQVPRPRGGAAAGVVGADTLLDAFVPGRIFVHRSGRTVTDEHVPWTYKVMNTHPLHYDRLYSTAQQGPMSGEPIVYGGLIFAWLLGLASRDVSENAVAELGWHDGYHTQPTFAGDTVAALSRVLRVEPLAEGGGGVVRMQLVGVKNLRAEAALERFGEALFMRENDKRERGEEKIPEKIFEIERDVLIRSALPT